MIAKHAPATSSVIRAVSERRIMRICAVKVMTAISRRSKTVINEDINPKAAQKLLEVFLAADWIKSPAMARLVGSLRNFWRSYADNLLLRNNIL